MAATLIAILLSLASFVFALLVWVDSQRARREQHHAVALSATHTARILLDEAVAILARVDALVAAAGLRMDDDTARRYAEYHRMVAADRRKVEKAMTEVAFGTLSTVECRALAASSTLVTRRTIEGRGDVLDILRALREQVAARPVASTGDGATTARAPLPSDGPRTGEDG